MAETGIKNPDYRSDGRDYADVMNNLFGDLSFYRENGDEGFAFTLLLEFDDAVTKSIKSVILAHADVLAGIVLRAALANDDVTSNGGLSTEKFHSESFTSGLTTVLGTTNAFFVCHISKFFRVFYSVMLSIWILLRY